MIKIDWYGNDGRSHPAPGTVDSVECGVCGTNMNVTRNVIGSTSYAETISGGKHRYDNFECPQRGKIWHRQIYKLKSDVYLAEIDDDPFYEEKRAATKKKILRLLEVHAAR